ncbi:MAG: xylose ABC transporter ATP-binding protein [Clostridia bacterium]|nr:xylose ABC transporter ATP-binding protein [Clostridia bacterium]
MDGYMLEMRNISKEFPGVKALDDVNFQVKKGEIHALCGENGAGKSTLMKILSGVYPAGTYEGEIIINGQPRRFQNIRESEKAGVAIIYQELALVKQMTIGENLFLGHAPARYGVINWEELHYQAGKWLQQVGLSVNPATKVADLGIGQQQLVEIAKALSKNAEILVLDEPTAALTESEVEKLMGILQALRARGLTCIYISHKLNEVFDIADKITVLRDGKTIATRDKTSLTEDQVISLMVGRELKERFPKEIHPPGELVLEIKNFSVYHPEISHKKVIDNLSFGVSKGEILGIAGLMGAGRTELVTSLFGAYPGRKTGDVLIDGKKIDISTPFQAIRAGIGLVSEDRKRYGLVLEQDVKKNVTLSSLEKIINGPVINENEEIRYGQHYLRSLKIKAPSLETKTNNLSGGNQQKVVLAKWLMTEPKVLILDEPTRGIDVGAKFEIYNIMNQLAGQGVAVIIISSELPEILGMSDRILVMYEGRFTGEYLRAEATQEKIMYSATGGC